MQKPNRSACAWWLGLLGPYQRTLAHDANSSKQHTGGPLPTPSQFHCAHHMMMGVRCAQTAHLCIHARMHGYTYPCTCLPYPCTHTISMHAVPPPRPARTLSWLNTRLAFCDLLTDTVASPANLLSLLV